MTTYPYFDLQDVSTTLVLSSVRDHPIRLNSALSAELVASYPLVSPTTEAFITPHSLLFSSHGTRFLAGSDSLLSLFDVSRPGQQPISSLPTAFKRNDSLANPGSSLKGVISALCVDEQNGILAAGTFSRHVGLYGSAGSGECAGVFTVAGTEADEHIRGGGITQVVWSPCGRYLYIVERKSDGVMVYDIRQTGHLVCWLEGRKAMTNQRLEVRVVPTESGNEVWAGGTDGSVRVWSNADRNEGARKPDFEFSAHGDAVTSTAVHKSGGVLATCAGQRRLADPDVNHGEVEHADEIEMDNRLKIWAV